MQLKFFTIHKYDIQAGEAELNRFLRGNRVLTIEKELVASGADSYWFIGVEYLDGQEPIARSEAAHRGKVDYREILNESDFAIFSALRKLRKEIAEREGVPVYAIFTNEQLAEMARRRVLSPVEMQQIDGIGDARIGKYGAMFLEVIELEKGRQPDAPDRRDG